MSLRRHGTFLIGMAAMFSTFALIVSMTIAQAANIYSDAPDANNSVDQSNGGSFNHVFFIRQSSGLAGGVQKDVKIAAYYPASALANWGSQYISIDPGYSAAASSACNANPSGSYTPGSPYLTVQVTDPEINTNQSTYPIRVENVCNSYNPGLFNNDVSVGNNQLYASYRLTPIPPQDPDPATGLYKIFINIHLTQNAAPDDGVGIRLKVNGPTGGPLLGERGGDDSNFPIIGSWGEHTNNGSAQSLIRIPFGLTCDAPDNPNARVGVYDADNGPKGAFPGALVSLRVYQVGVGYVGLDDKTNQNTKASDAQTLIPADGSSAFSDARVSLKKNTKYVLIASGISTNNTVDLQLPTGTESIYGADNFNCPPPITKDTNPKVYVYPTVTGGGSAEVNDPVTFSESTSIAGFPVNVSGNKQWGWNAIAKQTAHSAGVYDQKNGDNTYWVCPDHAPDGVIYDTRDSFKVETGSGDPYHLCQYYYCDNAADLYNGKRYFYAASDDNADAKCAYRCPDGSVPQFFAVGNDRRCYVQPTLLVVCYWDPNPYGPGYYSYDYSTGNGATCTNPPGNTTIARTSATPSTIRQCMYPQMAWVGTPPGHGVDENGNPVVNANWTAVSSPPQACATATIGTKPYLKVFDGDVISGTYPKFDGTSVSCVAGAGTINTWNKGATGAYLGSGGTDGVVAAGTIGSGGTAGFRSNNTNPYLTVRGLTFANTNGLEYGGNFGSVPQAACNQLTTELKTATALTQPRSQDFLASPTSITGNNTYKYTGDVFINGNIMYSADSVTNVAELPRLKLIVTGNIYIANYVTRLDGDYVAVENAAGAGGNIYTCAYEVAGVFAALPQSARDNCNIQLTVNGALTAKTIKFHRTYETLRDSLDETAATSRAAEIVDYNPSVWLPRGGLDPKYTSVTGLPPIL